MTTYEPPAPPSVPTPPAPAPLPSAPKKSHRGFKIAAGATALVLAGGVAGAAVHGLHRTEAAQNQPAHEVQAVQSDQVQIQSNGFGSTSFTYPIAGSTATATGGLADALAFCWKGSDLYTSTDCTAAYQYWSSDGDAGEAGLFAAVVTGTYTDYLDQVHANRNYDSANSDAAYMIAGADACMYQAQGYSKTLAADRASKDVAAISSDPAYNYIGVVTFEAFQASDYDCTGG